MVPILVFFHSYTCYCHFIYLLGCYLISDWTSSFEKKLPWSLIACSTKTNNGSLYLGLKNETKSPFWGLVFDIHRSFDPSWHAVCSIFWVSYALYWHSNYKSNASLCDVEYDVYSIMAFLLGVSHCVCCILHLGKYLTPKTTWFNSKNVVNMGDCVDCVCHNLSFVWIWVVGIDEPCALWDNSILVALATESWSKILIACLSIHVAVRFYLICLWLKRCTNEKASWFSIFPDGPSFRTTFIELQVGGSVSFSLIWRKMKRKFFGGRYSVFFSRKKPVREIQNL